MEETYNFEDRQYLKPEVSRDEQLGFIDNLRSTQTNDLNKISRDTYNMGTPVTSNLGGLHGSEGVWGAQHVSPQTNALVADLKATAQASALNTALSNMQQQYKNAYDQVKRNYTKRHKNGNPTITTPGGNTDGDVDFVAGDDTERSLTSSDLNNAILNINNDKAKSANAKEGTPIGYSSTKGATSVLSPASTSNANTRGRTFTYTAPSGTRGTINIYKNAFGIGADSSMQSTHGRDNVRSMINNMSKQGYKFYNGSKQIDMGGFLATF